MGRSHQGQAPGARRQRSPKPRSRSSFGAIVLTGLLCLGFLVPLNASAPTPEPLTRSAGEINPAYASLRSTAVIIGDSQTQGAGGVPGPQTWVQKAFSVLGYRLVVNARGGTGYVAATPQAKNYPDALESGAWTLPKPSLPWSGSPLVVVQGGGNDARIGSSNSAILSNAARLLDGLKKRYPESKIVMIGTLGKGSAKGGRRAQVDALLGTFASSRGLPFISAGDWLAKFNLEKDLIDGTHLDADGHQILSEALRAKLKSLDITGPTAY